MKQRKSLRQEEAVHNFWPSFADVMSAIVLILFFLMLLTYLQSILTGNNLKYAKEELEKTQAHLNASKIELETLQKEIDASIIAIEKGEEELRISQEKNDEQQKIIAQSNLELENVKATLEEIAVFRMDILQAVKESIEQKLGVVDENGNPIVTIGDNANIIINESLMFDYNSYKLKNEGKAALDQFALAFEEILNDPVMRESIDAIVIGGHTDDTGDAEYNWELSTKRANEVVNYLLNTNKNLQTYGSFFSAAGYSKYRPIVPNTSEENQAQNRRIEISIAVKDSHIQEAIHDYMDGIE